MWSEVWMKIITYRWVWFDYYYFWLSAYFNLYRNRCIICYFLKIIGVMQCLCRTCIRLYLSFSTANAIICRPQCVWIYLHHLDILLFPWIFPFYTIRTLRVSPEDVHERGWSDLMVPKRRVSNTFIICRFLDASIKIGVLRPISARCEFEWRYNGKQENQIILKVVLSKEKDKEAYWSDVKADEGFHYLECFAFVSKVSVSRNLLGRHRRCGLGTRWIVHGFKLNYSGWWVPKAVLRRHFLDIFVWCPTYCSWWLWKSQLSCPCIYSKVCGWR